MVIEAYTFSKKMNSTAQPSGSGTQISVVLKENTSVLNPHFLVHNYSFAHNYVKWGSRYYFVDDIVSISHDMAEYICRTDVLATYKSDIGASSQYVIRSASAYDGAILDIKYPTKSAPSFGSKVFSGDLVDKINSNGIYVLGIKNEFSSTGVSFYAINPTNMATLFNELFSGLWLDAQDISVELQKMLVNPTDYIVSCYWFPFSIDSSMMTDSIYFGFWQTSALGLLLYESERMQILYDTVTIDQHPQAATRGKYLNGSPYTRVTASIYGFGRIPLDANLLIDSQTIGAYIRVDLFTGVAELALGSGGGDLAKMTTMFGVPVQISQITQDVIKPFVSAFQAAASFAAGDIIGTAGGIGSAILGYLSPQVQSTGSFGSKIAFEENPHIFCEWYPLVDEDNAQMGRPLCSVKTISTLSGFIQCENADLATAGSPIEKDTITSYMNSGFYYE